MRGRSSAVRAGAAFVALLAIGAGTAAPASSRVRTADRSTSAAADFPTYMYDAAHSAFSPATAIDPTTSLRLNNVFQENAIPGQPRPEFISTPLVLQHVIYVGSNTGEFYAIDLASGAVIWKEFLGFEAKFQCRAQGFFASATSGIDPSSGALTVYAASGDGNIYALRASDGTVLWKSPVNVPSPGMNDYFTFSSPEVANGKLYVGISAECDNPSAPFIRGGVAAVDQATGNRIATYYTVPDGTLGGSVWTSPAVASDGSVLVTTGNAEGGALVGDAQSIVRLDGNTLQRIDGYQLVTGTSNSDFGGSPTVFSAGLGGVTTPMVGACNKDGIYYAWKLNALSDGPVWQVNLASHQNTTGDCDAGAIWDGANLYVAGCRTTIGGVSYRGSMRKLDPATGAAVWVTGLPAAIMTSPTLDASGAIAAASFDTSNDTNTGYLIDAATGASRLVDDGNLPAASSPVFGDQSLVIATVAGSIYTYDAPSSAGVPNAPTAVTAVAGDRSASVAWTAPADNGSAITSYTVTASPGGASVSVPGTQANAAFGGLANGTTYTFTVTATNAEGNGPASAPSNAVTPSATAIGTTARLGTSRNPTVVQNAVLYTTTIAPTPDGGTVSFRANGAVIGGCAAVPVSGGRATCSTAHSTSGTFAVQSVYSGTAAYRASSSNIVSERVDPAPPPAGYWMVDSTGTVFHFGAARAYGSARTANVTHFEPTPSRGGYWIVNAAGQVYAFGDAPALGSAHGLLPGEIVASLSSTPSGRGYWLFTNRGRVLHFGDARSFGDLSGRTLNGPVIGSIATPTGRGYYMVASDGGIFSFGDARFHGSMGGAHLNEPVNGLVPTADNGGYWLVASDGGIFAFGDARFHGSMGAVRLNRPVVGMVRYGNGYLMVGADGGIFDFSDQPFLGSLGGITLPVPIVSVAS